MKTKFFTLISLIILFYQGIGQDHNTINYFNAVPPPNDSIVIFAKGIVSLDDRWEEKICFSPDGKEVFFGRHPDGNNNYFKPRTMYSKFENSKWSTPDTAVFSRKVIAGYPIFNPDGNILYMEQPIKPTKKGVTGQIVFSKKKNNEWSTLKVISPNVTAKEGFGLAQITKDSTFYFHDRFDRVAYSAKIINGKITAPKPLPYMLNPIVEFFVSPDNDYIIFMPLNWSNQFHITFKVKHKWSMPIPFSAYFKKEKGWDMRGYGPYVSPDGNYFFFGKKGDIYWVKADFIEGLRKKI
ncbi:hypothetical protein AWE51_02695 [Aquimarina aggregata]|uniref:Uncharacterized protein n=1 Tax=Aquimarina aggregata TaxID=1642818 RepID=A0A163CFQ8_9FLAO|nr:hypothetical protein [Aquimarina aggregata]KZS42366.1 hypothetical protein AWE51_02695 [Aquimarina aggregata]